MKISGVGFLVSTMFLWGFASILIRLLQDNIAPEPMLFFRFLFSIVLLGLLLAVGGKKAMVSKRQAMQSAFAGFLYTVVMFTFILGIEQTTIANTVLLQQLSPIYVAVLSYCFIGEKISKRFALSLVLGLVGAAIIVQGDYGSLSIGGTHLYGDLIALLSGVFFAAYTVTSKHLSRKFESSTKLSFWALLFGSLFMVWAPFTSSTSAMTANAWLLLLAFGMLVTALPMLTYNSALRRLKASTVALSMLMLPLVHSIYAFLLLGEVPHVQTFIGGAFILGGLFYFFKR